MSETTTEANAFVAAHLDAAEALGAQLADLTQEPEAFLTALVEGLPTLTDAAYLAMIERACPGTPTQYAVRGPLSELLMKPVRAALREGSSVSALHLAGRLTQVADRDLRLFALEPLRRALPSDPEMSWQLLRRLGRKAEDWIAVDSLAELWARGILAESFRWAELEQLLYSTHVFERRLVPATLASLPHRLPAARRDELRPEAVERALDLVRLLMGDAEEMVQKALSWAIREWTRVDAVATSALLAAETALAVERADGARAWVIRDSLSNQPPDVAAALRDQLAGLRRAHGAPSTSIAASQAASFAALLAGANDAVAVQGDRYTRSRT